MKINITRFSKYLDKLVLEYPKYEELASNFLGESLEKMANERIGHLQQSEEAFPAWQELADSTKRDKERLGYVFNSDYNPLYRTGELRDSIGYVFYIVARALYLGSDSEIMVYQELGTQYIPPRSVLAMTMYSAQALIMAVYGKMLLDWISGKPLTLKSWY